MRTNTLRPEAARLADYMSHLSEKTYSAGWMQHLEFALWLPVINGPATYGRLQIEQTHIDELRRLGNACKGWVYFDPDTEETWIPLEDWKNMYAGNTASVSIT